jgi:hypothetical protein
LLPISLSVRIGIDTQSTPMQVGQGLTGGNLTRFKNNLVQKLGGCVRLSNNTFSGIASFIMAWAALNGTQYIGIGTSTHLELLTGGTIVDITPAGGVGSGDWTLDKWGQNLVGAPAGGTIYQWVPPVAGGNIAVAIATAPANVNGLIVAAPEQQIIAWGVYSATLGAQDPMLVGWCDVADLTDWTATAVNQAGTFRIPNGSRIVDIQWYGLSGLLWTDLDLWSMTYSGFPLVYGFNKITPDAGLIGTKAAATLGVRIAWMGQNDFFLYQGGGAQALPCTVRDFVFNNLDRNYTQNIHADSNTWFNEIKWYFPMKGSNGVCNGWAKWSPNEGGPAGSWDYGMNGPNLSAWWDESVIGAPIGADYNGLIQQFEMAVDFDGVVYDSFFETGWFQLAEGEESLFIERINPDFTISAGGQVQMTIYLADEIPQDDTDYPVRTYGPYVITSSTPFIIVRGSGRVARFLVECIAPNTFWRYGKPLARVSIDGRR